MTEAYLAGRGLASALGPDLDTALAALSRGGVSPARFELGPDMHWPFYRIADDDPDWVARAQRITRQVATESGALAGPRTGPLFLASSSLDMGLLETTHDVPPDFNTFARTLAGWLDWRGPVFTVSTACTSGLNALLSARAWVRDGLADHALVLGLELRNRVTVGGFGGMQLLSPDAAQPYGESRSGLVLGEAVAALQVSSTPSRWRVAGGANVVDGRDPAGTIASAVVAMCREALAGSGLQPGDIALIKPQAAGGGVSDATELRALRAVFDPLPPLVSMKASIGHTLGASGVAEIALLTACLETGVWPQPSYALDTALNPPLALSVPQRTRHLLAAILGFGGGHAAVILADTTA